MSSPYAASFSGTNYLSIPNYTGNPAAFSVSCWVFLGASQKSRMFFSNFKEPEQAGWGVGISDGNANRLRFYLGANTLETPNTLLNSTWYHCVFTYDGTVARIYLGGNTTPINSLTSAIVYAGAAPKNWIGAIVDNAQMSAGRLAAVGYWSKVLTTAEVTSLFNSGSGRAHADLTGSLLTSLGSYHDFADATNLGLDSSAAARHYTNTGAVARTTGPAIPSPNRTASVAGNWSNPATWGGLSPPGGTGMATINVAVTLDGAETEVAGVIIAEAGSLTWGVNTTLRTRGDVVVTGSNVDNNYKLSLVAGSRLIFDATAAGAGVRYGLQMSTVNFARPMLYVRATAANPAIIESNLAGGALSGRAIDSAKVGQGCIDAEYLNLIDLGDATNPAWIAWPGMAGFKFRMVNCNIIRCGMVDFGQSLLADSIFILDRVQFSASKNVLCVLTGGYAALAGVGVRSIMNSAFDRSMRMNGPTDFTIKYTVFEERWFSTNDKWAEFSHNFFRDPDQGSFTICGDIFDCYYLEDSNDGNPHGFGSQMDLNISVDRVVIESVAGGGGDLIFPHSPTNPRTFAIRNCIMLPMDGPTYATAGKLVSMLGGPNTNAIIEHNTFPVSELFDGGTHAGETYGGHTGMVNSLRSNLGWRPDVGTWGHKFVRLNTPVQDLVSAANANYNWGWNLAAGSEGKGYHALAGQSAPMFSVGSPGANDGSGDPQFVDRFRNLAKWAVAACGSVATTGAGKRADAIAAMRADPAKIDALLAYVRAGFAPQNAAMQAAAHDSAAPATVALGAPGAVALASPSPAQTISIYDTFDGSAGDLAGHVGQVGAAWSLHPAANGDGEDRYFVDGLGKAYSRHVGYGVHTAYLASGLPPGAEYDLRTDWLFSTLEGSDLGFGVLFRSHPTENRNWRLQYDGYQKRWKIVVTILDSATESAPYADNVPNNTVRAILIKVRTAGVTVNIDGVDRLSHNDTTTVTGGARVGFWTSGVGNLSVQNGIYVETLAVGVPGFSPPAYDVSGPAEGPPEFDSDAFRVRLAAGQAGPLTVTPAVAGIAGTFTPAAVTMTATDRVKTFIFRPSVAGTAQISFANGSGLINAVTTAYVSAYAPPVREAFWASQLYQRGPAGNAPYVAGPTRADGTGGYALDAEDHYDPYLGFDNIEKYSIRKGLPFTDYAIPKAAAQVRFRDRAVRAVGSPGVGDAKETPGVPGYHLYATGIARHYFDTSDPGDIEAARILVPMTGLFGDPVPFEEIGSQVGVQREQAFALSGMIDHEWLGLGPHPCTDAAARTVLGHIAQVVEPAATKRYGISIKPFMGALSARALISYWDRYRTSTVPAKVSICNQIPASVKAMCGYLYSACWIPPGSEPGGWDKGAIRYQDLAPDNPRILPIAGNAITAVVDPRRTFRGPSSLSTVDDYYKYATIVVSSIPGDFFMCTGYVGATRQFTISQYYVFTSDVTTAHTFTIQSGSFEPGSGNGGVPDLNHMIFPAFAWSYWHERRVAGNFEASKHFRTEAFAIFNGCLQSWAAAHSQKVWNQSALWTTEGLDWIARGDAEWPAATAFTLQPPASGATGPHSVASGAFRLSYPYGFRVPAPEPIVLTSSTGVGSFSNPSPLLTGDLRKALFTFTPAAGNDGQTVQVSAVAPTLIDPAPVAYAVGTGGPSGGVIEHSLAGPASGVSNEASAPFTVTLGAGTVTGAIRITPTSSAGTGTFTPPFVDLTETTRSGTFTYTPTSTGGRFISTTDNANLADPPPISYAVGTGGGGGSAVTTYSLAGPASGVSNEASAPFTVTLGTGTASGSIRITPAASAGTGSFTPSFVDLTETTRSGTFTYTPTSPGVRSISTTDNAGLTDPSLITYTASAALALTNRRRLLNRFAANPLIGGSLLVRT